LKKELSSVGVGLLGEMLGKADVDEDDDVEDIITTKEAIILAEELGIVSPTDAMRLCCTNHFEDELPQTPDGFTSHAPSPGCPVA
jgi:hypothetical protein